MLKHIPSVLSPQLLAALYEMGHADAIVLGDAHFPAKTCANKANCTYVRADGVGTVELLKAILYLMPLDYSDKPVKLMQPDRDVDVPIWMEYKQCISEADARGESAIEYLERFDFYHAAEKAFVVVQTGDVAIYANMIIHKGVVG